MRLRQIEAVLEDAIPRLDFETRAISDYNVRIGNFQRAIEAARKIRQTGVLLEESEAVLLHPDIVNNVSVEITIPKPQHDSFKNAIEVLRARATRFHEILHSELPEEPEHSIAVRLPDESDLDDLCAAIREVKQALEQAIVNPFVGGSVRLASFDRGSNWMELVLGSAVAVRIVGYLLRLVLDFESRKLDNAAKRELVRNLGLQNDFVAAAERKFEEQLDEMFATGIETIADATGAPEADHEYRQRLKHSFRLFSDLIQRGLEIHPALVSPADVRDTFPSSARLTEIMRAVEGPKKELETPSSEQSA